MRIEHRGEDALTLWMESGESILLRSWLEEYPMMSGEDRTLSERSAIPRKEEFDQQLRSCLQEHAQSNQDRLRRWMEEGLDLPSRLRPAADRGPGPGLAPPGAQRPAPGQLEEAGISRRSGHGEDPGPGQAPLQGAPPPDGLLPDHAHAGHESWMPAGGGLVAVGGSLEASALVQAYRRGIFPWSENPVTWWCPDPRAVIEPGRLHVPRSLEARCCARSASASPSTAASGG